MCNLQTLNNKRLRNAVLNNSGGHGTRTHNPLRDTCIPSRPLAIRLPSVDGRFGIADLSRALRALSSPFSNQSEFRHPQSEINLACSLLE